MAVQPVKDTITIPQGADFAKDYVWENADGSPKNLAGWSGAAVVRQNIGAAVTLLTFTVTIDAPTGTITISAPGSATASLDKHGVWDLLLTGPGGEKVRLVEGDVHVDWRVT